MFLKNKLMIAFLACMLGLIGCSDSKEESAAEVKKEETQMSTEKAEVVEKTEAKVEEVVEKTEAMKADAEDAIAEQKTEAKDALDETLNKADDVKDEMAAKAKEACIKTKKALGESTDDC